jgi:hypothetical protein
MCYTYTIDDSTIKKNASMPYIGKWMELENITLSEVSQFRKTKVSCFLSYVEDRPNTNTSNTMKNRSC